MANKKPIDSLDSLQHLLNDVTVQIGKALKASSKQPGRRDVAQVQSSLQTHMPNTIESFHSALDDLEIEIMRAKASLQRDFNRAQTQNSVKHEQAPVPVMTEQLMEAKPPQPMEPLSQQRGQPQQTSSAPTAPMAPVPDMGGGMAPTPPQSEVLIKSEPTPAAPQATMEPAVQVEDVKPVDQKPAPGPAAPEAMMDGGLGMDISRGSNSGNGGNGGNDEEFHFTDMTFGLAPSHNESQDQGGQQQQQQQQHADIDLSTFGNADLSSLDKMLMMDTSATNAPVNFSAAPQTVALAGTTGGEPPAATLSGSNMDQPGSNMDDIFNLGDDGSIELSMELGDGGDSSNFDSNFFNDDKFDDEYFGLG